MTKFLGSYPDLGSGGARILHPRAQGEVFIGLQIATPSNPPSGYDALYFKSDGNLYRLTPAGTETKITLSGGIVNADIAIGAAIAYSKLALTGGIVNTDISGSAGIAASKLAAGVMGGSGLMTFPGGICPGPTSGSGGLHYWSKISPGTTEQNTGISGRGLALVYARVGTNLFAALVGLDNSNFGSGNGAVLAQWGGSLFGYGDSGSVVRVYWNTQFGTVRIKNSSGSTVAEVSALIWMV